MAVKIAINGFGRIGRLVGRIAMQSDDVEIVAINDLGSINASAHLFEYDSLHGHYNGSVEVDGQNLVIDGRSIPYLNEKDPENLPWESLGVQIVVEGTGRFRSQDKAGKHIKAGAKKVIITAPGKDVEFTLVMGVNHKKYRPDYQVISMASCTTNCLAPVAKVLMDEFGIVKGFMNTVHSYTNDQRILDLEHSDLRRARAAALSIIPTTTGAASALGLVIPELEGKLDGLAVRVPTPTGSLLDLTLELEKPASREQINAAFLAASKGSLQGILHYTEVPLVSSDYRGSEYSAIVDGLLTMTMGDRMAKIIAWYDNEWAYSVRIVDTVSFIASQGL
jgi:glyceraldehyde 3-phosphate dehydrogenase